MGFNITTFMGRSVEYWCELDRTVKQLNLSELIEENFKLKTEIKLLKSRMHTARRSLHLEEEEEDDLGF